jgi:hypothetical protein
MNQVLAEKSGIVKTGRRLKFLETVGAGLLLSAALFVPRASASVYTLTPGNTIAAASSTYPTGGTTLLSYTGSFASSTIAGTVTSYVISGDSSNPYGGLTFEYLLTMTGGNDNIDQLSAGGYAGFQTDVSYNPSTPSSGGIAPSFFSRSTLGVNNGDTLDFSWLLNKLSPGQTGDLVVVQTGAHIFGLGSGSVIDSSSATVALLAPVPEPQFASLAVMGLGALFIFLRRNSK